MNVAVTETDDMSDTTTRQAAGLSEPQRDRPAEGCGLVVIRGIMPRSGTNFVADLLRLHPAVTVNPADFWEFAPLRFTPLWKQYVAAIEGCKHTPGFDATRFEPHIGRAWVEYLSESAPVATSHLVVKEPSVDFLTEQYRMFPDSRTVIVVRDARDQIASAQQSGFVLPKRQWWRRQHWRRFLPLGDFRALCRMYVRAGSQLLAFLEERADLTQGGQVQVVRYEDVVADTRGHVVKLLEDLQLSDQAYDWHGLETLPVRGSSFLRNDQGKMDFSRGQPKSETFRPVGRWADWTQPQRRVFEEEVGETMRRLGYEWDWASPESGQ